MNLRYSILKEKFEITSIFLYLRAHTWEKSTDYCSLNYLDRQLNMVTFFGGIFEYYPLSKLLFTASRNIFRVCRNAIFASLNTGVPAIRRAERNMIALNRSCFVLRKM